MELAASIGVPITEFWDITPFELSTVVKGYAKRQEQRQKESMYQAYLISRWVWAKKVDIKKYLGENKPKRRMTDEEMLAQVRALNAIFGGEVVKRQLCETE
jgi:predicted Co/Zn/Cd cation transporter (cation efflux family)